MRKMEGHGIAKVLFLVNQVALANQQGSECRTLLKKYSSHTITGDTQRSKNEYLKDFIDMYVQKRILNMFFCVTCISRLTNTDDFSVLCPSHFYALA